MRRLAAAAPLGAAAVAALLLLSGGSNTDPEPPSGFPGRLPAFMEQARPEGAAPTARARRWLARSDPLGPAAPAWARRMYRRSLLVLRALTDRRSGAVVAGARPGWAYVWPRDAGAVAIAFAAAGYRAEARRVARFLLALDLDAAARFYATGKPVEGRAAQGDAAGWVAAAADAAGLAIASSGRTLPTPPGGPTSRSGSRSKADRSAVVWTDRTDYQEKESGDYLTNAIASGAAADEIRKRFATSEGLAREEPDDDATDSDAAGLDSAAAWAVRPFRRSALFPLARRTMLRLTAAGGRFGLLPSGDWDGGDDPWTAPTAWTAWSLAALSRHDRRGGVLPLALRERRAALKLMAALRRASTPLGLLPERVDAETGAPRSTTPLAWSHAFAILVLRELWP
jgi:hypothetical protein